MPWYRQQDAPYSALDVSESNKRVLQGAIGSQADVEALSSMHAINGAELRDKDKNDTGLPDLTRQRVMVLVKATGEALSVQVQPPPHPPTRLCP